MRTWFWVGLMMLVALPAFGQDDERPVEGWPRAWQDQDATLTLHEPQVESWDNYETLKIRVAVEVEIPGDPQPWYASAEFKAKTVADLESRKVQIYDIETTKLSWQSTQAPPRDVSDAFKRLMPVEPFETSLDGVLAHLDELPKNTRRRDVALKFDPPEVFYSEAQSVLVTTDGAPEVHQVQDSPVMQVVNTEWDIFFDKDGPRYLLRDGACWYQTDDLEKGTWSELHMLPESFFQLPDVEEFDAVYESTETPCERKSMPNIFVATSEATVLEFNGKPEYAPIAGTDLLYATNTESDIFMYQGKTWLLLGGRWFSASSAKGPWNGHGEGPPQEFAKIPEDHEKAGALAAVPGTREALEASMAAEVPQQAEVALTTKFEKVTYVGEPNFVPISGTKVQYADNTSYDVFLVGNRYWICVDGVWFVGSSAAGPFGVASSVDPALYTIPSSSPKHHVTYVYVYNTTPSYVVYGYTSPYYGVYVHRGCVVYGSGYRYSYGWRYHAHFHWGWHYHRGYRPVHYHSRRYAPVRYNPRMRGYQHRSYGRGHVNGRPYRSTSVQGRNAYSKWGKTTVQGRYRTVQAGHHTNAKRSVKGARSSTGAKAVRVDSRRGSATVVKDRRGNVYAGRDGKVYRKDGSGYQRVDSRNGKQTRGRTNDVQRKSKPTKATRDLDRVDKSRDRGRSKSTQYNNYRQQNPRQQPSQRTPRSGSQSYKGSSSSKKKSTKKKKKSNTAPSKKRAPRRGRR